MSSASNLQESRQAVPCPACAAAGSSPVYRLRDYRVVRCDACGLLFNADFGRATGAAGVFSSGYYLDQHREGFAPLLVDHRADLSLPAYERGLDHLEAVLPARGRLLDVGAGLGTFLRLARDRGWAAEGVEISGFAAEHIRERHGVPVFEGDLAGLPAADGSFDAITFWDSIEHVERPGDNLRRAWRLLRPGGALLLTTDNFDCLIADLASALYRLSAGAVRYPIERLFIDRNASFFSADSIASLARDAGFAELAITRMEYPLGKIKTGFLERQALRCLYAAAAITGREAQVTLTARRPPA